MFIDSRQLKICSTCFELTLALLRVLEMIVCVNPELITLSPSNQMISVQFNQIICQILNRLTITGCFDFVIGLDIQELDSISHFQVLSAGMLYSIHCTICSPILTINVSFRNIDRSDHQRKSEIERGGHQVIISDNTLCYNKLLILVLYYQINHIRAKFPE